MAYILSRTWWLLFFWRDCSSYSENETCIQNSVFSWCKWEDIYDSYFYGVQPCQVYARRELDQCDLFLQAFEVYSPNSLFRRRDPGHPDHVVCISSDDFPKLMSIKKVEAAMPSVPVLLATVENGDVMLFKFENNGSDHPVVKCWRTLPSQCHQWYGFNTRSYLLDSRCGSTGFRALDYVFLFSLSSLCSAEEDKSRVECEEMGPDQLSLTLLHLCW